MQRSLKTEKHMNPYNMPIAPLKHRISTFTVERGTVEIDGSSLAVVDVNGVRTKIPVGSLAVLMLEPGATITHAAIKLCAEARTLVLWTGEAGVRLYAAGSEGSAHSYNLLRQAQLALDPKKRLVVARAMYSFRFSDSAPAKRSIEQLRGMEGARVREIYRQLSKKYGVPWSGRAYDMNRWAASDDINKAISAANSCLYGLCHAAILIGGLSAAIGFIHTGYALAFVHDLADLWKMETSVEAAFRVVAAGDKDPARQVRLQLRDLFRETRMLETIIPTMFTMLQAGLEPNAMPSEIGGASREPSTVWDMPWNASFSNAGADLRHEEIARDVPEEET